MVWLASIALVNCLIDGHRVPSVAETRSRASSTQLGADAGLSLELTVTAVPAISHAIVSEALNEASVIWNAEGLTLRVIESSAADERSTVRVVFEDAQSPAFGLNVPLGWIAFSPSGVPERTVHISRRNAERLMDGIDAFSHRPSSYKELLIARALGRALAHELGHYLMASKSHSASGLMKANRLAEELFSPTRGGFALNDDERRLVADGLLRCAPAEISRCSCPA